VSNMSWTQDWKLWGCAKDDEDDGGVVLGEEDEFPCPRMSSRRALRCGSCCVNFLAGVRRFYHDSIIVLRRGWKCDWRS